MLITRTLLYFKIREKLKKIRQFRFILQIMNLTNNYMYYLKGQELFRNLVLNDSYNFEKQQKKLLYNILKYAQKNVPYYKNVLGDLKLRKKEIYSVMKDIPLLSKDIIRSQGTNIFSVEFDLVFSGWMNTGGSTGEPLKFPVTKYVENIHQRCLYKLMGWTKGERIVSVDGSRISEELRLKNIFWKEGGSDIPYGSVHYSTLYMNDGNIEYYLNHLNKMKPAVIRGYPSGLIKLAKFGITNKIPLNYNLVGIYLTSEYFDESSSKIIRDYFNCPIYGQYGHAESSVFGFTLGNSLEYICSPVYGYTEVLDVNGNPVNVNEIGEIVVTGFYNKAMPFIRYKTGDLGIFGGTQNGIVKLNKVQGRTVDFVINNCNEKIYLIGLVFGGHLNAFERIKTWQILQVLPGSIIIKIVQDIGYSSLDETELMDLFLSVGVRSIIEYVEDIPLTRSGKKKFVIQNLA